MAGTPLVAVSSAEALSVLEAAPDAFVTVNSAGQIVFVNAQTERLFGYPRSELLGQPVELLLPERFHKRHVGHRDGFFDAPRVRPMGLNLDLCGRNKDGREFPVEVSLSPVETPDGVLVTSAIRDVSERRKIERELHEQAHLLDLATDAIFVRDFHTAAIRYWNRGAAALYGWTKEDALGKVSHELLQTQFPKTLSEIESEIADEGHWEGELTHRGRDGTSVVVVSYWTVEWDPTGEPIAILEVNRDITERKRIEEQLKQQTEELARSNAELQQFAYVASHDLQEPLRMVASYTQLLARRYKGKLGDDADEFIGFAVDGAQRMQSLIQDLLAYSRVSSRAQPFVAVDCNAVVDRVLSDLSAAMEEARATVTRDDLPTVSGDPTQLGQLFLNLIGNAIKFHGAEPPIVHVAARREADGWLMSVRDNGIGIEPQYAERIFVIFQRLHGMGEYPGTGIGLAICKKIVERHGGRIWVESGPGQGSTFFFTFPIRR
jgi:PAS domain S-box-containing protein